MLHSHVMWVELEGLELLTNNNYKCGDHNIVQRIIGKYMMNILQIYITTIRGPNTRKLFTWL